MEKTEELVYSNGVYISPCGKDVFCPVCYLEKDGLKSVLKVMNSVIISNIYYECTNPGCCIKIFPKD